MCVAMVSNRCVKHQLKHILIRHHKSQAEAGANIVSIHLPADPGQPSLEEAIESVGRKCTAFEGDVGDSVALRRAFQSVWNAGVVPDILLNCAGLNRRGPIEEMTDEKIDLVGSPSLMLDWNCVANMKRGRSCQSTSGEPTLPHKNLGRNCVSSIVLARSSTSHRSHPMSR